jgi:hypothetical protein
VIRAALTACVLVFALAACTNDAAQACEDGRRLEGETPLPAEIAELFERNCWICHTDPPAGFAPFPLVTWEDVQVQHRRDDPAPRYLAIARRIRDEQFPMPPRPRPDLSDEEKAAWPKLSEDEKQTIEAWVADCAPPGE